ncbi:MAG: S-layer homology domain-containing protein, partial [Oscillospiraceae bacterium]|nr:S-layer homology domain-containing protein [Oscillospiraceae bacterium]
PPVYPAADPKPELNTADHYAYIIGYPGGEVKPNVDITRAETATIFFRMLTDESRDAVWSTKNSFTDVNEGDWFNNAVSTMENSGIIKGYPDGTFKPNAPITRAEFAAIAARFDKNPASGEAAFSDTENHWAADEISKAARNGWVNGYEDGTFRPDKYITRAEAMTLLNRVLQRNPRSESDLISGMRTWIDNPSDKWYYLAVQEATNSHEYTRNADGSETWVRLTTEPDWSRYE